MKKRLSWVRDFARERRFSIGRGGWEWGRPGVWGWNLTQTNTLKRVTSASPPRLGMESDTGKPR